MVEAYPETSKIEWGFLPTTTMGEVARVCCGWHYKTAAIPDLALYLDALERIQRAVTTRDPAFPVIENVLPERLTERLDPDTVPLFRPQEVYPGMRLHFPETCPSLSAHHFPEPLNEDEQALDVDPRERTIEPPRSVTVMLPHLPRELAKLHDIIRSLAEREDYPPQREVAREIGDKLHLRAQRNGDPNRVAEKLAAMIRPDSLAE